MLGVVVSCALFGLRAPGWGLALVPFVCLGESQSSVYLLESSLGQPLLALRFWVFSLAALRDGTYKRSLAQKTLLVVAVLLFSVKRAVSFFVIFELSLVPIAYLILAKGERPERLLAVYYLAIYTIAGGAFHFLALVFFEGACGRTAFRLGFGVAGAAWASFIIVAFFVKAPCYRFHFWLPKAHVEAPTVGSIILAAILLKFGLYGLLRYLCFVTFDPVLTQAWFGVFLVGSVLAGLAATKQPDLKRLVAYSSVAHMTLGVAVCLVGAEASLDAALMVAVSHGLSARALFGWAGVVGAHANTRNVFLLRGLRAGRAALFKVFVGLIMVGNCMPPMVSFWGELARVAVI